MSTTPQQVIIDALTILGVVFPGQTPGASILTDAFTRLNDMLASWSIERLIVYGIEKLDFNLVTNTNTYTIGPTGTFAGTRPISIVAAQIIIPSGQRFPLKLITTEEWNDITDRAASSSVPKLLYDDFEYSNSTLYLWPTPLFPSGTTQLELQIWQPLEQFSTLSDTFDMPPGYQRAVTYNLAAELAMVYGRPMTQDAAQIAMDSKNNLKSINAPPTHISGMGEEAVSRGQVAQGAGPMAGDAVSPVKR